MFPASTRAAVHGVRMKIGNRVIEAKIDRRQAARESYEAARREGKRASLLEQERPNVFTMNVANIMPGDRIAVDMDYSEMLVPDEAVYEFVYPTVVGPRYAGGADPVKDKWMANPHLPAGTPEPYRFDINVHLETGIALKELSSPSHPVAVNYAGPARADVRLGVPGGGNRDFVLRYRLSGDKIESGLLLWEGEGGGGRRENFFALMMEPPRRPTAAQIPAREYIFLLDVSGSMHGFPLDTAKTLMRNLLGKLRPTDSFNIVLFSGAAHVRSPQGSIPARKDEIAAAIADIERVHAGGGTELMGGLELAYQHPAAEQADVALGRRRHRRLRRRRGAGVSLHPRAAVRREPVFVRHRQQREPRPHRGHGARGAGRAVRRAAPGEGGRRGGQAARVHRAAGADRRERRVLGLRRLRGRAAEAARPDGAPAAGAVRQVPRQRRRPHRGQAAPAAAGRCARSSRSGRPTCAPKTRRCAGCGRAAGSRRWTTSARWARARRPRTASRRSASTTGC